MHRSTEGRGNFEGFKILYYLVVSSDVVFLEVVHGQHVNRSKLECC